MVFVTEPMRLTTHIKPDEALPDSEAVEVLKLNDLRKFPTGIYDYSVMTSVFSAVEEENGIPLFGTMKVAFSAQEWCGTVAERMVREESRYEGALYSYFESEGEQSWSLPHRDEVEAEENLWIAVRELRGPMMAEGETREIRIVPAAWNRRKRHKAPAIVTATLAKGTPAEHRTDLGSIEARPFTWRVDGEEEGTMVWVETAYPHRILSWEEPDGTHGEIQASRREPYWKQNANRHRHLRNRLRLPALEPEQG
jgi:hypothetical protein